MIPMLWPVYAYGSGEREHVAVFFDYSAGVSFINDREQHFKFRECYFAEPKYDHRPAVSDVLGEQLTETRGDPFGDAARAARAASLRPQPASRFSQSGIAIARKSA